jgi:hypothetical protein
VDEAHAHGSVQQRLLQVLGRVVLLSRLAATKFLVALLKAVGWWLLP